MRKLNITNTILDKLGFSEYCDEHGTYGGRTLTFSNGVKFRILEYEEMDDDTEGYSLDGWYIAHHFYFGGWFSVNKIADDHELYFLHEMYQCIEIHFPSCLDEFRTKCNELKMNIYIEDYLKNKTINE